MREEGIQGYSGGPVYIGPNKWMKEAEEKFRTIQGEKGTPASEERSWRK